jgi:hypothetical protein
MRLSCYGEVLILDPTLQYTEIEVFDKCLTIREHRPPSLTLEFEAQLNFNYCPSVPVPFPHLLFVCNLVAQHHNDQVLGAPAPQEASLEQNAS